MSTISILLNLNPMLNLNLAYLAFSCLLGDDFCGNSAMCYCYSQKIVLRQAASSAFQSFQHLNVPGLEHQLEIGVFRMEACPTIHDDGFHS